MSFALDEPLEVLPLAAGMPVITTCCGKILGRAIISTSLLEKRIHIVLIITDQEREVMHWPQGWADANLPARSRLMAH